MAAQVTIPIIVARVKSMAKKAKVTADKSALDAVENALSIDFEEMDGSEEADLAELEKSIADTVDTLRDNSGPAKSTAPEPEAVDEPAAENLLPDTPPAPANDDHNDELNDLLYAIQQKPCSRVFLWTVFASLLWLGLCAYYGYLNIWPDLNKPVTIETLTSEMQVLILAAVTIIPLMPLWGLAMMMHRAIEMRHAAGTMTKVSMRLLQPEKISADSIATVGTAIRREMTAIGDGVERAIARAGELEFMVQKEVMSLERSYGDSEVRLRRLIDDIGTEREEVINHAEKLRNSISESQAGLTSEIEVASNRIEETLKSASGALTQTLDNESLTITSRLKDTSDGLIDLLSRTGSEITENLGAGTENLKSNVTEQIREMSEVVSTSGQAIATLIDGRTASFDTAATNITDKLETGRKAFDITFTERADELGKIIVTAGQSVSTLLKSGSSELAEQSNNMLMDFEANRKHLESTFNHQSEQFEKLTNLASDNISSAIDAGSNRFEENVAKVAQQIEDSLSMRASDLSSALTERMDEVENTLSTSGSNLVSALGMRTEALDKVLKERAETIGSTIAERLSGFGQNLTGHVDDAVSHLKEQTDELQEKTKTVEEIITKRAKSVEETIKSSTIEFATGLNESLKTTAEKSAELNTILTKTAKGLTESVELSKQSISQTLEQTTETLNEQLTRGTEAFSREIGEKQEALAANLDDNTKSLQEALDERANNLSSKLNQGVHRVSSALVTKGSEAAEDFERFVGALEERMKRSSHSIEKQFAAGSTILRESLDEGQASLLEAVSKSVSEAGSAIHGKAEKLSELLNERANLINNTLGSTLLDTQRQLESKTAELDERIGELNASLSARSSELSSIIEQDAKPIVATIESTGEAINNQLAGMSKTVADQAHTLFANLTSSNEQLEDLIKSAGNNLSLMQTTLGQQSNDFAQTVDVTKTELEAANKVAVEVEEKLQSASTNLMQNMASIANRLEAQGSVLQDATRLIDAAQSNLEQTLDEKQVALQDLSAGLMLRSDEISTSVSSFAQMISEMVDDIQSKSRGTGGAIAAEVSSAIDDATARFGDSVEAMRGAAATIRRELDETREQMRRGVLELPDETAQSAAAMRRVVTDQIAALKDLSSIVERSGKALDSSQGMTQQRAIAGQQRQVQPVQAAQTAPQVQQPAPTGNFPPDTQPRGTAPAFDATLRGTQQSHPAQNPAEFGAPAPADNSGWVSDLLRRASSDEPRPRPAPAPLPDTRSPDHMVESLNSLSMDIASAIDHEASIDLWERYQRGETNVFTRRLYTLKGQKTFDEIRRKYVQNADFRNAVNRYIDDFERLLGDVSRNDQGGNMAQSYLTSDTGKVYTMLAHASGRFENS